MDVVIVGAGLAGLACATRLMQRGVPFVLLEATDRVGGRVQTDTLDGFLLDHGFQCLSAAVPAERQWLNVDTLGLRTLRPHDSLLASEPLAVPAAGMQQLPQQLAAALPAGALRLQATVEAVEDGQVRLTDGSTQKFGRLVLATEFSAAQRLAGGLEPSTALRATRPATAARTCFYFAADESPAAAAVPAAAASPATDPAALPDPLDTPDLSTLHPPAGRGAKNEQAGGVEQVVVISDSAPEYAPPGKSLISVNLSGSHDQPWQLEAAVRRQLHCWYGPCVERWRLLRTYHLPEGPSWRVDGALDRGWEAAGEVLQSMDLH